MVIALFLCGFLFCFDSAKCSEYFSSLNQYYDDSHNPPQIKNNHEKDNNHVSTSRFEEYMLKKLCNPGELKELTKDEIEKHLEEIAKTFLNNGNWINYLDRIIKKQQEELNTLKNQFTKLMNFLNNRETEIEVLKKTVEEQNNQIQFLFNK